VHTGVQLPLCEEHRWREWKHLALRTRKWQKWHDLYSPQHLISAITLSSMRLSRHAARMRMWEINSKFSLENLKGWGRLGVLGVGWRIILKLNVEKLDMKVLNLLIWLGIESRSQLFWRTSFGIQDFMKIWVSVPQPLWDRGPANTTFIRRGPGPNKCTRK
jgi:hypothetical protein